MKKGILVLLMLVIGLALTGCKPLREWVLRAPDEIQVPEGSSQAVCMKDDIEYTYVYQNDGVYLFYIDGVLQDDEALNHEQEQAFLHEESVINYLNDEYGQDTCVITDYVEDAN